MLQAHEINCDKIVASATATILLSKQSTKEMSRMILAMQDINRKRREEPLSPRPLRMPALRLKPRLTACSYCSQCRRITKTPHNDCIYGVVELLKYIADDKR